MGYQQQLVVTVLISDSSILQIIKPSIFMPMNFRTSAMEEVTTTFWGQQLPFETRVIDTHNWLLFNVDRLGFYRVNYDSSNWISLTHAISANRSAFSDKTLSQLIDDSLNLARDGLLSYRVAFTLLEVMQREESFGVWSAAASNLRELNNRINDLDIHEHFKVRANVSLSIA
jgi:hypothetical protein